MKLKSNIIWETALLIVLGGACGKTKSGEETVEDEMQVEQPKPLPEGAVAFDYARHLYFDVMLHDTLPAKMVFDTGNTNILLDLEFYNKYFDPANNLLRTIIQGAGNSFQAVYRDTRDWRYSIGDESITEQGAVVMDLRKIIGNEVDGMFGMEFMRGRRVEVNYSDQYMRIMAQGEQPAEGYVCVKCEWMDSRQSRMLMPLKVSFTDGSTLDGKFLVDLGAGDALAFNNGLGRKVNLKSALKDVRKKVFDTGGVGGSRTDYIFRAKGISLAGYEIKDINASYSGNTQGSMADNRYDGLIGNALLEHFDVIFDFAKGEIWLRKSENFGVLAEYDSGMTLTPQADCWVVNGLIEGGNAHKAGVKRGDVIISINGLSTEKVNHKRLKRMNASADKWDVVVKRDDATQEISFEKEKL